jgi:hypothetical protein
MGWVKENLPVGIILYCRVTPQSSREKLMKGRGQIAAKCVCENLYTQFSEPSV